MDQKLQAKAITDIVDGKLLAVASEEVVDRDGDILTIDGWDLKNFKNNPVLLYQHNLTGRTLPIGRAKTIGYRDVGGKKKLVFEPEFEEITEEGKIVAEFYKQGFMKAWSVGFIPKDAEKLSPDGEWPPRYKYNKQELIEISAVPIPALPSAVVVEGAKHFKMNVSQFKDEVEKKLGLEVEDDIKDALEKSDEPKEDVVDEPAPAEVIEKPTEPQEEQVEEKEEKNVDNTEIKSGRTLSKTNENKIRSAVEQLTAVLASLDKETDEKDEGKSVDERLDHVEKLLKTLIGETQAERKERKEKKNEINIDDPEFLESMKILARAVPLALQKAKQLKMQGGRG